MKDRKQKQHADDDNDKDDENDNHPKHPSNDPPPSEGPISTPKLVEHQAWITLVIEGSNISKETFIDLKTRMKVSCVL